MEGRVGDKNSWRNFSRKMKILRRCCVGLACKNPKTVKYFFGVTMAVPLPMPNLLGWKATMVVPDTTVYIRYGYTYIMLQYKHAILKN